MKELYPEIAYWSESNYNEYCTAISKNYDILGYVTETFYKGIKYYVVDTTKKVEGIFIVYNIKYPSEEIAKNALVNAITIANRKIKIENLLTVL